MSFKDYISQKLASDVQTRLRLLSSGFPNVQTWYDPRTSWFAKGTIRAETFTYLRSYASQNDLGAWIIAARQSLPVDVRDIVASVALADPSDASHVIAIRVSADMNVNTAIADATILADYQETNPSVVVDAYTLFAAPDSATVAAWAQQITFSIEANSSAIVTPFGISPVDSAS